MTLQPTQIYQTQHVTYETKAVYALQMTRVLYGHFATCIKSLGQQSHAIPLYLSFTLITKLIQE